MQEPIELLHFSGHCLWTFAGEVVGSAFINSHLRRRGMNAREAGAWMRARPSRHVREIPVGIVALMYGAKTLGWRIKTNVGERCATSQATRAFLRREFSVEETRSLLMLAPRERVPNPESVRRAVARGIAA